MHGLIFLRESVFDLHGPNRPRLRLCRDFHEKRRTLTMDSRKLNLRTLDRRTFLGTGAIAAAAVLAPRLTWAAETQKIDKVGVQLYTVRDDMKRDFEGTIAKVASIGYKEVEFAGYFDHTPQQVRAIL